MQLVHIDVGVVLCRQVIESVVVPLCIFDTRIEFSAIVTSQWSSAASMEGFDF